MSASSGAPIFSVEGDSWVCRSALTLATSAAAMKQSESLALPASGTIRFSENVEADSSALAVMLALVRRAEQESRTLKFEKVPQTLQTLAHVYGVDTLLFAR